MGITRLPIEPYWANAAFWWLENRNCNNAEFNQWLYKQGVIPMQHEQFHPWIYFEKPEDALIFQLRWA